MGPQELNPAAPTQVGTGADGQPIYEGSLKDQSSPPDGGPAGGSSADDDASPDTEATAEPGPNGGGDETATTPVDTGDATFVDAQSDPDPDVIPIAGDSADDPNMGESADPAGVDTGDATFAPMGGGQPELPPFDSGPEAGPVTYPPSSDPGAGLPPPPLPRTPLDGGLPPPPLPKGWVMRDGHPVREVPTPLDGGLPPPPLPKGWIMRDGHPQRVEEPAASATSARPRWVIPAVIVGVVVLGTVGFAATRGGGTPTPAGTTIPTASLAAPTIPPTATVTRTTVPTVAPAAARVTDTKVNEQGNVCLDQTVMTVIAKIDGAKAGDTVVFKLSGPGLPATVSGQLDGSGSVSATMGTVGPVKGNQSWSAAVQSVAGKDVVSGPSQVFGFCPSN